MFSPLPRVGEGSAVLEGRFQDLPSSASGTFSRAREKENQSHFARLSSQNNVPHTPSVVAIIAGYAHGLSSSGM